MWVADGLLHLIAREEAVSGAAYPTGSAAPEEVVTRPYSSARIQTRGKASFLFGRIEARARLPKGQGLWPAIWMLPEHDNYGPYPQSGEIDIAEAVNLGVTCGGCVDRLHGAVHHGGSPSTNRTYAASSPLVDPDAFHVFALEWTRTSMTWFLDGEPYFTRPTGPPFDQRFHLIINLAVGGLWPESAGLGGVDGAALPAALMVDWVRVYSRSP